MKYAAKRVWPEAPKQWEYEGDAEQMEAFALEYASSQQLAQGTEIIVIEKGGDLGLEYFRVTSTEPYAVVTSQPRLEREDSVIPTTLAATGIRPFIVAISKMTMIAVTIGAVVLVAILLMRSMGVNAQ